MHSGLDEYTIITKTCLADEQNLDAMAPVTARLRSVSPKAINGVFLANLKESFFGMDADCFIRSLPTAVGQVNETFLTIGDVVRGSPKFDMKRRVRYTNKNLLLMLYVLQIGFHPRS